MLDNVRVETRCNSKQLAKLINTVNDILERFNIIEEEQTNKTESEVIVGEATPRTDEKTDKEHKESEAEADKHYVGTLESTNVNNTSIKDIKDLKYCNTKKENIKCSKCEYMCKKSVNITKHINTKHPGPTSGESLCKSKCSLCEDLIENKEGLEAHIKDHIDEIKGLDVTALTNNEDIFECNLCSFESGVGDSIKKHLIDHVNYSNDTDKSSREEIVQSQAQTLLDEYNDDGNYMGDDSALIDRDSEQESNNEK